MHRTIAKKLSLAGHQCRGSTYALVEVKRARVNRDGFRLVILVRLGAPRKHGVKKCSLLAWFTSLPGLRASVIEPEPKYQSLSDFIRRNNAQQRWLRGPKCRGA